jgi:hypothetical protein
MTSDELAVICDRCQRKSVRAGEPDRPTPDECGWVQAKMLAEIAFQLAVANERAAPPVTNGVAFAEYSPLSGVPVRRPL